MPYPRFPQEPEPDFERLRTVLARGTPDRVPFIELSIDFPVLAAIREDPFSTNPPDLHRQYVEVYRRLGYDYCPVWAGVSFSRKYLPTADDTAGLPHDQRSWLDETHGTIETWADFEQYPWPTPKAVDYTHLEQIAASLPDGMKIMFAYSGVLEHLLWLMSYQGLSYAMADQPDLVDAMVRRIGELLLNVFKTAASHESVGALWLGDDMAFKTQTLVSPDVLRRHVFPWQRRLAETAHAVGKPFLLHSCGNIGAVMEELIEEVGIDALHSFEDVIEPVTEAKRRWGDRIALLGGVDMDVLARGSVDLVRRRTREVLEVCMPGGGYALGSGNSVANYIPLENYFAMLEEGWRVGSYAA